MTLKIYKNIKPTIAANAYIDDSAIVAGEVFIDEESSIWPLVAIRGDVNKVSIGKRSNIQDGSVLHVTRKTASNPAGYPLLIGDDVTVGHKVMLHGCTLGNRILVGMGAIVMDNATVGDDVIIGAGSLVPPNKHLESGYLYVGSPVKQARKLTDEELAFLPVSASNYVLLKEEYLQQAKPPFALPDLCDELSPPLRIAEPLFTNYGGNSSFYGEVVTVACFEDNSMVKRLVSEPGHGKVMVVDGRGSLNKALLGDMLAEQAVKNGWHGFVINGCVRDVDILKQLPIGIKALAAAPQKTEKLGKGEINQKVQFAGIQFVPGEYLYADNNGVLVSSQPLL